MSDSVVCTRCGHRNVDRVTFCASCGSFLEWGVEEEATELDPEAPRSVEADASAIRLTKAADLAKATSRPDLGNRLTATAGRLTRPAIPIAVAGQFKVGKSSLVNAVVNAPLCPASPLVGSVVPTVVGFDDSPSASVVTQSGTEQTIATNELGSWVTESENPANRLGIREARVGLPRRFLESGLMLVDTPGLGGLDSPAGRLLAQSVEAAAGVLLVTSAVQELSRPELEFLERIVDSGPLVAVVVTKIDLIAHWRRIVELNRGHLDQAGIDASLFPVSSTVRQVAASRRDPALNDESGYPALLDWLTMVARHRADHEARRADRQLRDATAQLRTSVRLAERVLQEPEKADQVMAQLEAVAEASEGLTAHDAEWRDVLETEFESIGQWAGTDLQRRLEGLRVRASVLLEDDASSGIWAELESWVRREATEECVQLLAGVAERLGTAAGSVIGPVAGLELDHLDEFPTVGSLGATLMVGPVGQGLVTAIETPPLLSDPTVTTGRAQAATLDALKGHLDELSVAMADMLAAELSVARRLVVAAVEDQGSELVESAEAAAAMTGAVTESTAGDADLAATGSEVAGRPAAASGALSLADLRKQLDGLSALESELAEVES